MFDIELCMAKRISLVTFYADLAPRDFADLDRLAREERDPSGKGFHVIFDMSRVEVNELVTDFVASRGQLPQTYKDYDRFYVVSNEDLKLLVRLYIAYQESQGAKPPILVETLDEALQKLGATRAEFQKYAPPLPGLF